MKSYRSALINRNVKETRGFDKSENIFLVLLTCFYVFAWYLQLSLRIEVLGAIRFEFLLGLLLSVVVFFRFFNNDEPTPLFFPVLLFFLVLLFYTVFSYDRSTSWDVFYNRVVKFAMLGAFIAFLIKTEWGLKLVIGAFLLAMFKMGQEGFVGAVTGGMVWENQGIPRLHGSTPLYRHPNSYSGMAVGCLPFIFYLYPICSKWKKIFLILLFVFSITIIVYTGSRTGYIATVLIFIYLWRERLKMSRVKYLVLGIGASLVAVYLLPDAYMGRFISIFTLEEAEGASANARIRIIEDAVSVFLAKPWGVGVAAFPAVRMEMFGEYQDTHNLYLELLTNLSFFGLLGFLYLIYKILKTNFYIRESSSSKFIVAISNSIIAFVYARLFLGLFGMDTYEIYWWFAVGVTVSMYRIVHEKDKVSVLSLGNQ